VKRSFLPNTQTPIKMIKVLKVAFGIICFGILTNNFWLMSHWSERRGIPDDACYLRQAHLFQKLGLGGLDTDIASEKDRYFERLANESGHSEWFTPKGASCHIAQPGTTKRVLQYPPGTGFLLSLFPEGFQFIPLYATATSILFCLGLSAILYAQRLPSVLMAGTMGAAALYLMINPTKVSYSSAPTMVFCAAIGFFTALFLKADGRRDRWIAAGMAGLLLGLSVCLRLPNLLLSAGYFVLLARLVLIRRELLTGVAFGVAYAVGLIPTLVANAINAGSPFATTYGGQDVAPPQFSYKIFSSYLFDTQGLLVLIALAWLARLLFVRGTPALRGAAIIVGVNLLVSGGFFLTHPIFSPYYLMPAAMLSLWTLLFTDLQYQARLKTQRMAS
jgi:hypothetical protein